MALASDPYYDYLRSKGFVWDTSEMPPAGVIDRSGRKVYKKGTKEQVIISRDATGRSKWLHKFGGKVIKTGNMLSNLKTYMESKMKEGVVNKIDALLNEAGTEYLCYDCGKMTKKPIPSTKPNYPLQCPNPKCGSHRIQAKEKYGKNEWPRNAYEKGRAK